MKRTRLAPLALTSVAVLSGCGSCQQGPPAELRVEGASPYVRCVAADPPEGRRWRVGDLELAVEGRTLHVAGLPGEVRIAAFGGPAPSSGMRRALDAVEALRPDLVLVLGGLGDGEASARETLSALAELPVPVLVVPGGRDSAEHLGAAFEALPDDARDRVVDAAPLWRVDLGRHALVVLAGAPEGRYARGALCCGYGDGDLEAWAERVGEGGDGRRWLIAWAAPAGPVAEGIAGGQAGDPALREAAEALGLAGGVFAWPRTRAGRPVGDPASRELVVPPVAGPAVERADGSRLRPRPTLLRLTADGLRVGEDGPASEGGEPGE